MTGYTDEGGLEKVAAATNRDRLKSDETPSPAVSPPAEASIAISPLTYSGTHRYCHKRTGSDSEVGVLRGVASGETTADCLSDPELLRGWKAGDRASQTLTELSIAALGAGVVDPAAGVNPDRHFYDCRKSQFPAGLRNIIVLGQLGMSEEKLYLWTPCLGCCGAPAAVVSGCGSALNGVQRV